jgi:hypothetical protein
MHYHKRRDAFGPGGLAERDPRLRVRKRPNPVEWVWYAFGGGLSPQLSQWVLRDTTGSTWWLRHIGRILLQLAPFIVAVVVFLPGPLEVRIDTAVLGLLSGLIWAVSMMWGTTEHRLIKAGFAPGEAEQARHERSVARRRHARFR